MPKSRYTKRSDGRYQVKVNVGKNAAGHSVYKTLYAATEKELKEKENALTSSLSQGIYIDGGKMPLIDWAREWLKTYKNNVSYNTRSSYENIVEKHIAVSEVASMKLKDVKLANLQKLINNEAEKGLTRTLELLKCTLVQIFDSAINNDVLIKNPAKGIELPHKERKEKRALTLDERTAIEKAQFKPAQKAFVYIALYAGLRRGEILALNRGDINFDKRTISVNKNLILKDNASEIKNSPKTDAGIREVPVQEVLYDVLREYLEGIKSDNLFTLADGETLITKSGYRRMWEGIVKAIDLSAEENGLTVDTSTITAHILRHTFATDLFYSDVDLKAAQRILGHSKVELTMNIYTHCMTSNDDVIQKLNRKNIIDTAELKPCPFCGGDVRLEREYNSLRIMCLHCRVEVSFADAASPTEVAALWNSRFGGEQ